MTDTVLVIDDEPDLRLALGALMRHAGFAVAEAADGRAGIRAVMDARPDLVLLDVGMPELDGWQVLERVRELDPGLPVIMVTAHGLEMERVRGLRTGADDYVVKPFGSQELLARVDRLLEKRRPAEAETYEDAAVHVDFARRVVTPVAGEAIELTALEFRVLAAFVRDPDRVLTHADLGRAAWGDARAAGQEQVRSAVRRVRARLGWGEDGPLHSVRGVGYRYAPGA